MQEDIPQEGIGLWEAAIIGTPPGRTHSLKTGRPFANHTDLRLLAEAYYVTHSRSAACVTAPRWPFQPGTHTRVHRL